MKAKKSLESRIRGWFPKEPNFPTNTMTPKIKVKKPKQPPTGRERLVGGLGGGLGAAGGSLILEAVLTHFLTLNTGPLVTFLLIFGVFFIAAAIAVIILDKLLGPSTNAANRNKDNKNISAAFPENSHLKVTKLISELKQ
jgi:hypothetical protein